MDQVHSNLGAANLSCNGEQPIDWASCMVLIKLHTRIKDATKKVVKEATATLDASLPRYEATFICLGNDTNGDL